MDNNQGAPWTKQEMLLLYHLKLSGRTHAEIADIMSKSPVAKRKYNENLIHKKWQQTQWSQFIDNFESNIQKVEAENDLEAAKQEIIERTIATHERFSKREQARTEIMIDSMKTAIYRLPKPKLSDITWCPKPDRPFSDEHVGVILSDLHIGESFTLQETGGLGEYNHQIFLRRLASLKDTVLDIAAKHRVLYNLPVLHIMCLGDIVAGMPEAGQWSQAYIDMDIADQLWSGVAALRDLVATWSQAFGQVNFYGIYGNHGRMARRGLLKHSTNWDRLCYKFVEESLKDWNNITWQIPTTWYLQPEILGHSFYLCHGDGIRGSMGIPFYGVARAESKVSSLLARRPDYFVLGHFHSTAELQTNRARIIMNGCFSGGDIYSLKDLGAGSPPEQKMFGIHKQKGVTWTYNIHLDHNEE
jgi:hypothetical protein